MSSLKPSVTFSFKEIRIFLLFVLTLFALGGAGWFAWQHFLKSPPYVDPVKYPIRGIDISAHNGMMNLDAAAESGIRFVFIKATEGESFKDENFRLNYLKARHAGLKIGAYHFFRFDRDGIAQARNLLGALQGKTLDLGVALDVESFGNPDSIPQEVVIDRLSRMIDFLNLSGYRVTVYSNKEGYFDILRTAAPGANLWICSFSPNPINTEWTFWQYNHHGKVKGIKGDVDLDVFCGSESEWNNYLKGAVWPFDTPPLIN